MTRTLEQIDADLKAAYELDRELKLRTPEYAANRQKIGTLREELYAAMPLAPAPFTTEMYAKFPDSFEQMGVNRKRAEALLESQHQAKAARQTELDRLYSETQRREVA